MLPVDNSGHEGLTGFDLVVAYYNNFCEICLVLSQFPVAVYQINTNHNFHTYTHMCNTPKCSI